MVIFIAISCLGLHSDVGGLFKQDRYWFLCAKMALVLLMNMLFAANIRYFPVFSFAFLGEAFVVASDSLF